MNESLLSSIDNRGRPPKKWLEELISWAATENMAVFEPNDRFDIYNVVADQLGPYLSIWQRRAVMCEVLRVLAGFESSWNWNEDYDVANPREDNDVTKSAGAFQVSADSMALHRSLAEFAHASGVVTAEDFRSLMMSNHAFACGYTARLLRITTRHHGPVRDRRINPWLSRKAVAAFVDALAPKIPA